MAIYEYKCPFGHTVELIRKMDERDDTVGCGGCALADPTGPTIPMTRLGLETVGVKIKNPAHRTMRVWSVPFHRTEVATAKWA